MAQFVKTGRITLVANTPRLILAGDADIPLTIFALSIIADSDSALLFRQDAGAFLVTTLGNENVFSTARTANGNGGVAPIPEGGRLQLTGAVGLYVVSDGAPAVHISLIVDRDTEFAP